MESKAITGLRHYVVLTLLLSWGVAGAWLGVRIVWPGLPALSGTSPVFLLVTCAPSLAAVIVAAMETGGRGIRDLLATLVRPCNPLWAVVGVAALPMIACLIGGDGVAGARALLAAPLLVFNVPAWGEEFGWRGFMLPRVLARGNAWRASAMVAATRIVWHLPAFVIGGMMRDPLSQVGWWAVSVAGLTCLMTALYLRTRGNVLIAGIIPHTLINVLGVIGLWHDTPIQAVCLLGAGATSLAVSSACEIDTLR